MTPADRTRNALRTARLYLLLSRRLCRRPPLEVLADALKGGCDLVQVRESEMPDGALVEWVREVHRVTAGSGVPLIVNNRPDIAMISGAEGVHLGQGDLPAKGVRELWGDRLLIGLSTHSLAEMEAASICPVDYCGLGPVYDTPTKGLVGRGLDLLREVLPRAKKPTFVIGGITTLTAAALKSVGVERIAISNAICSAADPGAVARSFAETFRAKTA